MSKKQHKWSHPKADVFGDLQRMRDAVRAFAAPFPIELLPRVGPVPVVVQQGSAIGKTTSIPNMGPLLSVASDLQHYRDAEIRVASMLHGAVRLVRGSVSCRADGIDVAHVVDHERGVITMQGNDSEAPLWISALRARDRAEAVLREGQGWHAARISASGGGRGVVATWLMHHIPTPI